jgi:mannose-6-phosphate isomerase-like protein (cupin superfamily)
VHTEGRHGTIADESFSKEVAMADPTTTEKKAVHKQSLDSPNETRPFGKGKLELVNVGGVTIGRSRHEPGWKWSEHVKPIAKTEQCEVHHVGYVVQGRMKIARRDGSEEEIKAGDGFVIPPGHDAWTVGSETVILLDFKGSPEYAKQR